MSSRKLAVPSRKSMLHSLSQIPQEEYLLCNKENRDDFAQSWKAASGGFSRKSVSKTCFDFVHTFVRQGVDVLVKAGSVHCTDCQDALLTHVKSGLSLLVGVRNRLPCPLLVPKLCFKAVHYARVPLPVGHDLYHIADSALDADSDDPAVHVVRINMMLSLAKQAMENRPHWALTRASWFVTDFVPSIPTCVMDKHGKPLVKILVKCLNTTGASLRTAMQSQDWTTVDSLCLQWLEQEKECAVGDDSDSDGAYTSLPLEGPVVDANHASLALVAAVCAVAPLAPLYVARLLCSGSKETGPRQADCLARLHDACATLQCVQASYEGNTVTPASNGNPEKVALVWLLPLVRCIPDPALPGVDRSAWLPVWRLLNLSVHLLCTYVSPDAEQQLPGVKDVRQRLDVLGRKYDVSPEDAAVAHVKAETNEDNVDNVCHQMHALSLAASASPSEAELVRRLKGDVRRVYRIVKSGKQVEPDAGSSAAWLLALTLERATLAGTARAQVEDRLQACAQVVAHGGDAQRGSSPSMCTLLPDVVGALTDHMVNVSDTNALVTDATALVKLQPLVQQRANLLRALKDAAFQSIAFPPGLTPVTVSTAVVIVHTCQQVMREMALAIHGLDLVQCFSLSCEARLALLSAYDVAERVRILVPAAGRVVPQLVPELPALYALRLAQISAEGAALCAAEGFLESGALLADRAIQLLSGATNIAPSNEDNNDDHDDDDDDARGGDAGAAGTDVSRRYHALLVHALAFTCSSSTQQAEALARLRSEWEQLQAQEDQYAHRKTPQHVLTLAKVCWALSLVSEAACDTTGEAEALAQRAMLYAAALTKHLQGKGASAASIHDAMWILQCLTRFARVQSARGVFRNCLRAAHEVLDLLISLLPLHPDASQAKASLLRVFGLRVAKVCSLVATTSARMPHRSVGPDAKGPATPGSAGHKAVDLLLPVPGTSAACDWLRVCDEALSTFALHAGVWQHMKTRWTWQQHAVLLISWHTQRIDYNPGDSLSYAANATDQPDEAMNCKDMKRVVRKLCALITSDAQLRDQDARDAMGPLLAEREGMWCAVWAARGLLWSGKVTRARALLHACKDRMSQVVYAGKDALCAHVYWLHALAFMAEHEKQLRLVSESVATPSPGLDTWRLHAVQSLNMAFSKCNQHTSPLLQRRICHALAVCIGMRNPSVACYYLDKATNVATHFQMDTKVRMHSTSSDVGVTNGAAPVLHTCAQNMFCQAHGVVDAAKAVDACHELPAIGLPAEWTHVGVHLVCEEWRYALTAQQGSVMAMLVARRFVDPKGREKCLLLRHGDEGGTAECHNKRQALHRVHTKLSELIHQSNATGKMCVKTAAQRKAWSDTRLRLDKEMGQLVQHDLAWELLGPYHGALCPQLPFEVCEGILHQIQAHVRSGGIGATDACPAVEPDCRVLIHTLWAEWRQQKRALKAGTGPSKERKSRLGAALVAAFAPSLVSREGLSVDANECAQLYDAGVKLVARQLSDASAALASIARCSTVVLTLDKTIHQFPLESSHTLRGHSVTRMLSGELLRMRLQLWQQEESGSEVSLVRGHVRPDSGVCVLNPSDDLPEMEDDVCKQLREAKLWEQWETFQGQKPDAEQWKQWLQGRDVLLYCGHSNGEQYVRRKHVESVWSASAVLLMGCASLQMREVGAYLPTGVVNSYMASGSCGVVGALWDVTDGDLNRFQRKLLMSWTRAEKAESHPASLSHAVPLARRQCRLRHMVGSAMVMYGIPLTWLAPKRKATTRSGRRRRS